MKVLLLISKDYRKWALSPIEHFQLEVESLSEHKRSSPAIVEHGGGEWGVGERLNADTSLHGTFPISVSRLTFVAELLLFS